MKATMNHLERWEAAIRLEEPDHVPVAPLFVYFHARQGGITTWELMSDAQKCWQAIRTTYEKLDRGIDAVFPAVPLGIIHHSVFLTLGFSSLYLDWRFGENTIPNFYEFPIFDDYDELMEKGIIQYLRKTHVSFDELLRFQTVLPQQCVKGAEAWYQDTGVPLHVGAPCIVPFDMISFMRGMAPSAQDLYRRPEKIKELSEWLMDPLIGIAEFICNLWRHIPGGDRVFLWAGRSSATFLSPKQFEDIVWPYEKRMIERLIDDGYKVYLHHDGDFTPMLDCFQDLPANKGIIFDSEKTNMKALKEKLGKKMCIYGNLGTNLLKLGTPDEVREKCKRLIDLCAPGGGFILGSECESPWDAPLENMIAVVETAREYGKYS